MELQEILSKTNLDWDVKKVPLFAEDNGEKIQFNHYGLLRSDNNQMLATCRESYTPVQNLETVQLLHEIANQSGLEIVSGGPIQDGKKIFIQMKYLEDGIMIGKDTVERYILAINSHDSSTTLAFGTSNVVKSCDNQFFQFYKETQLKFRHTKSYRSKIDQTLELIDLGKQVNKEKMSEKFNTWYNIKIDKEDIGDFVFSMYNYDISMSNDELQKLHPTRKMNRMKNILESIESEIEDKGSNVWGLFNGITYYTNHVKNHYKRDNGKQEDLIFGNAYMESNRAYVFLNGQFTPN